MTRHTHAAAWRCIIGIALIFFAEGVYLGYEVATDDHPVVQFERTEP